MLPFAWQAGTAGGWALLVLSGLLFGMGHFLVIRAFCMAPAALLTPFTYVQIIAAVAFGVAVFGDVPDLWAMIGTALIILAGIYVLGGNRAEPKVRSPSGRAAP
jgi:drug/metabolite transporter (DMT)-like permease